MEGIFSLYPPPLWKFQSSFIHLLKCLGLWEPLTPKEFPIPSMGGVWIFSGKTMWEWLLIIYPIVSGLLVWMPQRFKFGLILSYIHFPHVHTFLLNIFGHCFVWRGSTWRSQTAWPFYKPFLAENVLSSLMYTFHWKLNIPLTS